MAAILAEVKPGDEIVMPSYTFSSTANAFVLRGCTPVFVDIRPDTLNMDEAKIEPALTRRTKAIVVVHYGGVPCEMDKVLEIARRHSLLVIEDAAQGLMSHYHGRPVGSFGLLAATSFHETKNIFSGEGGALFINDPSKVQRAEVIWEKGTNRTQFYRGEVKKYTWLDVGSSYLPNEMTAAFLWGQLERADAITQDRWRIWQQYHKSFQELERAGKVRRPVIPSGCQPNGHLYHLVIDLDFDRSLVLEKLRSAGVHALFHYVPLHLSPAGRKYGRTHGSLSNTEEISSRLIRLPLWRGMTLEDVMYVSTILYNTLGEPFSERVEERMACPQ
jgi:dTDP-4-amino-4,6-dideoxygalactose transaminase